MKKRGSSEAPRRTIDSLATLKHCIAQHRQANTRPTCEEIAEWLWLVKEVERRSALEFCTKI